MANDKDNEVEEVKASDLELDDEALKELGELPNIKKEDEEVEKTESGTEEKEETTDEENEENDENENKIDIEATSKAYAQLLVEAGILDTVEGIKSFDDILSKEREKGDSAIADFISELPTKLKQQIEAHTKGLNIDELDSTLTSLSYLESLDDKSIREDIKVSAKLYREALELDGEEEDYINEMIQLAKDSDTIGKQGIRSKAKLMGVHKKELENREAQTKQIELANKKAQEEWSNTLNGALDGDKEIWEMKLNPKDKKEIKAILFDTVETRTVNGQKIGVSKLQKAIEEDPMMLVQIARGMQLGMFGKEGKLTAVKTKAKNEAISSLETAIKTGKKNSDTGSVSSRSIASYEKSIKAIDDIFSGLKI